MDITFACDKCGQSIVIDEAGAGQLADCPKCGTALEVPYKSQAATPTPAKPPEPSPVPASAPEKKCPFCAETIKREAVVCRYCGRDLALKPPVPVKPASVDLPKGYIICPNPNCGYQGYPEKRPRGNTLGLIILLLFCLVPGILYLLFKSGYNYFCPKCGTQVRSDW